MILHIDSAIHENAKRSFPIAGTNLERLLTEPDYRRDFHARLKTFNPMIVALYRVGLLPLFGAARTVMLLTTLGRRSHKPRRTPIGYFRIGGVIHVFSAWGKGASWYKNLAAHPEAVSIQIGSRVQAARAEILKDPDEMQRTLAQFVGEQPAQAGYLFGWDPARDRLDTADFSAIIRDVLIVRFVPEPA
jgi:deazaflavin-dependent oxidoreductase (nitroreductase family)